MSSYASRKTGKTHSSDEESERIFDDEIIDETAEQTFDQAVRHVNAKFVGSMAELWIKLTKDERSQSQVFRDSVRLRAFLEDQIVLGKPLKAIVRGKEVDVAEHLRITELRTLYAQIHKLRSKGCGIRLRM